MATKINTSWALTKASWDSFRLNKRLVRIYIYGSALMLAIFALAAGLFYLNPGNAFFTTSSTIIEDSTAFNMDFKPAGTIFAITLFIVLGIIGNLLYAFIVKGALSQYQGKVMSAKQIISTIKPRLVPLLAFGFVSLVVGQIIYYISSKFESFAASSLIRVIGDTAWGAATYFAVPIIVDEDQKIYPISATKKSFNLIKKVWGEGLITNFGFSLLIFFTVFFYFIFGSLIMTVILILGAPAILSILIATILLAGLILIFILFEVLGAILKSTLYFYATTNQSPELFNKTLLQDAFTPKKARKVFSE